MRYRRKRSLRSYSGVCLFVLLVAAPVVIGGFRSDSTGFDPFGIANVYARGLDALRATAWVALSLGGMFTLWLFASKRQDVNRRWLDHGARGRRHFVEGLRMVLVVGGAAALITGGLTALYLQLLTMRPEAALGDAPPVTLLQSLACAFGGLAAYAAGRWNRQ